MPNRDWSRRPLSAPGLDAFGSFGVRSSQGGFREAYIETGTTSADLKNYGVSLVGATAAKTFDIEAPVAGQMKYLFCTQSTGVVLKIRASTGGAIEFLTTAAGREVLQFNNDGEAAVLVGRNSSQWIVLAHIGGAYSTA